MDHKRDDIPGARRERNPLITDEGYRLFRSIEGHPQAPRWNFQVGDRLLVEDLPAVDDFRRLVFRETPRSQGPSPAFIASLEALRDRALFYRRRLPQGMDFAKDWAHIPTMDREDLALRLAEIVPIDAALDRVIAYDTSGATGHAVDLPTHPLTLAKAHVLAEFALKAYGVDIAFGPGDMACINVCAQRQTYVFANVFSVWNQAGFAKVNLTESEWPDGRASAQAFFKALNPRFITADPVALTEMIRWQLPITPAAMFSTAVALNPGLKAEVEEHFGCPLIDWYSTTETGPIAFSAPDGLGMLLFDADLYIEVVDEEGCPVADGQWGEITVSGGRNPYLPLLRYRTGDRGRLGGGRLLELDGRALVDFRAHDGSPVHAVDIVRILRLNYAFVQHEFVQLSDGSCRMTIRPAPGVPLDLVHMDALLREIFGMDQALEIVIDEALGADGRKIVPYRCDL